ncbi:hypothetical membrane protein [Thermoplasma acidophilum]|uniref:Hypothetical membrane protein n=1 Tax=Thermoplasma acidophilum (strain ATCC 25905 / DSM 1728 / JCM 9062 / NBRC 15155 / AMRC-C165) TaxID=273075 RepID=Q9HLB5_THEAC|nr:hypothetical protein [Thermoplasma acidophilum]CAC11459.1 hypothetical membrane protein [Thermoplasma acidophilum]
MPKDNEEPLVKIPEFDERKFLFDEKERAKSIVIIFIIGAIVGSISGYFQLIGYWYLSLILILVVLLFSEYILKGLGVQVSKKTSHRILLVGEFLLTWLVFWILVLNPPLNHVSGPEIANLQMYSNNVWTSIVEKNGVYNIPFGSATSGTVSLRVYMFAYSGVVSYKVMAYQSSYAPAVIPSHLNDNYLYFNLTDVHYGSTYYVQVYGSTTVNGSNLTSEVSYTLYAE